MDSNTSYAYTLIRAKASYEMLRKAEQVAALCYIRQYLEDDMIGDALNKYKAWEKSYPDGIDSTQNIISMQEINLITEDDMCYIPWIHMSLLETLCSYQGTKAEITAMDNKLADLSNDWFIPRDPHVRMDLSFEYAYNNFMKADWITEFIEKMKIVWPLTKTRSAYPQPIPPIPPLPSSPKIAPQLPSSIEITPLKPYTKCKSKVSLHWSFMRCKNVYKAYGGKGRVSYHDLLIWIANRLNLSVETLKETNPYSIGGIPGLPFKYGYQ
jgi:hypothetical protein